MISRSRVEKLQNTEHRIQTYITIILSRRAAPTGLVVVVLAFPARLCGLAVFGVASYVSYFPAERGIPLYIISNSDLCQYLNTLQYPVLSQSFYNLWGNCTVLLKTFTVFFEFQVVVWCWFDCHCHNNLWFYVNKVAIACFSWAFYLKPLVTK